MSETSMYFITFFGSLGTIAITAALVECWHRYAGNLRHRMEQRIRGLR